MATRMSARSTRRVLGGAVVAAALLIPAAIAGAASAATLALNAACYVDVAGKLAHVTIGGTGFTPGDTVDLGGGVDGTATVNSAGQFAVTVEAPVPSGVNPGERKFKVNATDDNFSTGQTIKAATVGHYTIGGVTLSANEVGFGKRITYYFGGFRPGKAIFGHYIVDKRVVGTHRFGKAAAPCGTLQAKATGFPVSREHPHKWIAQWDDNKKYKPNADPRFLEKFHTIRF